MNAQKGGAMEGREKRNETKGIRASGFLYARDGAPGGFLTIKRKV